MHRRNFLKLGVATGGSAMCARFAFAAPAATDARFVFIIQRGALDGLSAVPPYADPDYARFESNSRSRHRARPVARSPSMVTSASTPAWRSCTNATARARR